MRLELMLVRTTAVVCLLSAALSNVAQSADWSRFRGPNGSGVSTDAVATPTAWSETENLKWKVGLPGPGSSSPIVVGERVYVTCWSGYAVDQENPGDPENLKRHLVSIDRATGAEVWTATVDAVLPEDPYSELFAQHGYASHTPVSDGERIYVFFGKTGALALDLNGNQLWQTGVGTGSGMSGWGTASSPVLYKNLVIVTAAAESKSLVALDKQSGEEVWRYENDALRGTWGTPVLVDLADGRQELAIAVPGEIWGIDPDTGKQRWRCDGVDDSYLCASVFADGDVVYVLGGRRGRAVAVRAGGAGDVTDSHTVWSRGVQSQIATPLLYAGRIYWAGNNTANCIDALTGEEVFQSRVESSSRQAPAETAAPTQPTDRQPPPDRAAAAQGGRRQGFGGRGGGRFGGRGFGGGFGNRGYASVVAADGKLYSTSRNGLITVIALDTEFKQLAQNSFDADSGDFSATPAASDGQLFIRSSKFLYCVEASK